MKTTISFGLPWHHRCVFVCACMCVVAHGTEIWHKEKFHPVKSVAVMHHGVLSCDVLCNDDVKFVFVGVR